MKRQLLLFIGISFLWFCQGCEEDGKAGPGKDDEVIFSAKITNFLTGKAEDRFGGGNEVGISMVRYNEAGNAGVLSDEGNYATNVKYRQSAAGLSADRPILWGDVRKAEVYAYYPWRENIRPVASCPFKVNTRQDSIQLGLTGYVSSDMLWSKTTAEAPVSPVNLEFRHLMSQVVVHVKNGEGASELLEGSEIRILGHNVAGVVDWVKGEVKASVPAVTEPIVAEEIAAKEGCEISGRVVTIPQVIPAGTLMLQVMSPNGNKYKYTLPESLDFTVGGSREITITILPGGPVEVTIGEVTAWQENQTPVNGTASYYRVYKVGDKYERNGVEGMVYKVDETGEHGMIVSLYEEKKVWSIEDVLTEATSANDGYANMEAIRKIDPTFSKYPAFEWCENFMNKYFGPGWYIPSSSEFKELAQIITADPYYDRRYYQWIFPMNELLDKMWGTMFYDVYFTSTQVGTTAARAIEISAFLDDSATSTKPPQICFLEHLQRSKNEKTRVRAIRKF